MSIEVKINSIDRTKKIDVKSLRVNNILTQQIDTCNFTIRKYGDRIYKPDVGNSVEVYTETETDVLYENNLDGNENWQTGSVYRKMSFTPSTTHNLSAVALYLKRDSAVSAPGNQIIDIFLCDSNHSPTGSALATITKNMTGFSTTGEECIFTLTSKILLTAGLEYAIVKRTNTAIYVNTKLSSVYSGGQAGYSLNNGATWSEQPTLDYYFKEWGDGIGLIFSGRITELDQDSDDYGIINYQVKCCDYTKELNKRLVNMTYSEKTVRQIISDILSYYHLDDDGFTMTNVNCDIVINYISFKFQEVGNCIKELATITNYDWYVDTAKDIHFFLKGDKLAAVDVTDTNGNMINSSLVIRNDLTNIRNQIYVRGGDYLADTMSAQQIADGSQNIFNLGYKFGTADIRFTLTGQVLNYGIEPRDTNPQIYDGMWNQNEKVFKFKGSKIPTATSNFRVRGKPYLPVLVKLKNQESINDMISIEGGTGIHEYVIIDQTINTKEGARDRAKAELYAYAQTLSEGEFKTYTAGFRAGQQVRINSALHGIDQTFIINKVQYSMWTQDEMVYSVSLISTKTYGIIEFLQDLLQKQKKQISVRENEEIDTVESYSETITMSDTLTAWLDKNQYFETIEISDMLTSQIDAGTMFVWGPYVPPADTDIGLVAWYKFDEGSGTNAEDSSDNANDGTIVNATYGTGVFNSDLVFDGNDYVAIPGINALNCGDYLSISVWIKPADTTRRTIYSHGGNTAGGEQLEINNVAGAIGIIILGVFVCYTAGGLLTTGAWNHIVYTRSGAGVGTHKIYLNGNLQSLSTDAANSYTAQTAYSYIGTRNTAIQMFNGEIDDLQIFDRPITQAEVTEIYTSQVITPHGYSTHKRQFLISNSELG